MSISKSWHDEFVLPDYSGGGALNMMASIIRARGGRSPHVPLVGLPLEPLRDASKLILLVLDGLGEDQLAEYLANHALPDSFFARHDRQVITTVCPATTATAVTLFATGASPAEHGILGWHVHFRDLGMVGTPLPYVTRTGTPMTLPDFPLEKYLAIPSPLSRIRDRRVLISYQYIPTSMTSMAQSWWDERVSYDTLRQFGARLTNFAHSPGRAYSYAYWPNYDYLCHKFGPDAKAVRSHLAELDTFLLRLEKRLRGTDTQILITADHGLIRTRNALILDRIPGFYDCLTMLPSGDARLLHCFVRPSKVHPFLKLMQQSPFQEACVCISGEMALKSGLFGPGKPHPALESRVGDFILLARGNRSFVAPSAFSPHRKALKGVHGGLSATEMRVPLYSFCV